MITSFFFLNSTTVFKFACSLKEKFNLGLVSSDDRGVDGRACRGFQWGHAICIENHSVLYAIGKYDSSSRITLSLFTSLTRFSVRLALPGSRRQPAGSNGFFHGYFVSI